jgi:hypothetical protein
MGVGHPIPASVYQIEVRELGEDRRKTDGVPFGDLSEAVVS